MIPCALLLAAMALLPTAPFGDDSVLMYDASYQYLDFAAYARSLFTGENDLLYTFNKNMGGETVSLLSYDLLSPFSLLFGFATRENVPYFYTAVMILKLSVCGLSFFYAFGKRYGVRPMNLIFSTGYALMAYNTMYGMHIMWLDGVMILPLRHGSFGKTDGGADPPEAGACPGTRPCCVFAQTDTVPVQPADMGCG